MSKLWEKVLRPIMFRLDAERAHELGMAALRSGITGKLGFGIDDDPEYRSFGHIKRFGLDFKNPIGLAAGFDKNALAVERLADLGFGFVEVGTVTHRPQKGNPKPRLFRLPEQQALINRLGFNNDGAAVIAERLSKLDRRSCVVGVNIGRNKDVSNEDAVENYLSTSDLVSPYADYIALNVSSPNTPGLRDLQQSDSLENLVKAIKVRNLEKKPLLVKIAPDLTDRGIEEITDLCIRLDISGIIATNTTISRADIPVALSQRIGSGGLSGRPLERRATEVVSSIFRTSKGKIPIIGVGGIFSADDAFRKIAAGASLVQVYTGFVYGGPDFARRLAVGLDEILKDKGFASLDQAVGSSVR